MDYSATTPVDPRAVDKMIPYLREQFGNPASRSHAYGWEAERAVEQAREHVAALVNADPREMIWTSGATESNNLALKGAANFYRSKGKHIVTVKTEHKAVLDTARELERQGLDVTYLDVRDDGLLDLDAFNAALRPDTILASVMFVNNEIGVIQDIAAIGEICRQKGIVFHVDAAQAAGKVEIDLRELKVDLMSFSAHKAYGPKGIGALYVRRKPRVRIEAQMHGGGHERGMRSGTLATSGRPAAPAGCCGVVRIGVHVGVARAVVRTAGAGPQRRARAQLDPLHARPLHNGAGRELRDRVAEQQDREAARAVAVVGNAPGWDRPVDDPMGRALSARVLDHYENPRNVGSFSKDDDAVGTGMVGAPACGDVMKLQIRVGADGIIEDAKFKTYGCGSAIASSSLVTEWVKGKTLDQALSIKNTQIAEELTLPPVKIHCSILAEDAIKAAVADYKKRRVTVADEQTA
ncbi:hypothetical protein DFQ28_010475 [Apophysomyces sp. BC1034]|nr:hypothetical protein DFQ28_010475 [Apophysomyces sp. BC1034]